MRYNLISGKIKRGKRTMLEKPYHHGDLQNALIEAGIELINEKGIGQFSLRKVAAICGVSHTAPYAHFKDIDALMTAMSEHVTNQFMKVLHAAVKRNSNGKSAIRALGRTYISFFAKHPNYYQFLFYNSDVTIDLDNDNAGDYQPFALFRESVYKILDGFPPAQKKRTLIALWSQVHGITALLTNKHIKYSGDWRNIIDSMKGEIL